MDVDSVHLANGQQRHLLSAVKNDALIQHRCRLSLSDPIVQRHPTTKRIVRCVCANPASDGLANTRVRSFAKLMSRSRKQIQRWYSKIVRQ